MVNRVRWILLALAILVITLLIWWFYFFGGIVAKRHQAEKLRWEAELAYQAIETKLPSPCRRGCTPKQFRKIDPKRWEELEDRRKRDFRILASEGPFLAILILALLGYIYRLLRKEALALEEKQEFLTLATHELKHPVTSLSLTLQSFDKLPKEKLDKFIRKSTKELVRLAEQVDNLLKMQQLSQLRQTKTRFQISSLIESMSASLNTSRLLQTGKSLEIETAEIPLRLLLRTILENAISYSKKTVKIFYTFQGKDLHIEISDQGVGLTPEELEKVGTLFYRSPRPQIQNASGTGIGLYACRQLCRKLGWKLSFTSLGENKGTTVKLCLKKVLPSP